MWACVRHRQGAGLGVVDDYFSYRKAVPLNVPEHQKFVCVV